MSLVIPTFNEAPNVPDLITRIGAATAGLDVEIIFVDDSDDDTVQVIRQMAAESTLTIRLLHRREATGGLSGAVVAGMMAARCDWIVVMDGDLQHPPEMVPFLYSSGVDQDADVVVASRHIPGGSSAGLDGEARFVLSASARAVTRAMFPVRLRHCSDPLTGFFAVRRSAIAIPALRPRGFKILLEILTRNRVNVVEEPFVFGRRAAGESKATLGQGMQFIAQLAALRFGRLSSFAMIGAFGALANLLIMASLQAAGVWYLTAAIVAAMITIAGNFILQERFVFADLRSESHSLRGRVIRSVGFNAAETVLRTYLLWLIVESTPVSSVVTQAALIGLGFLARFVYHSRVVYRLRAADTVAAPLREAGIRGSRISHRQSD